MYGAIEAGGTKFVCSIGNDKLEIIKQLTIPTVSPEETMPQVVGFFKEFEKQLKAIAIGSFGPIDVTEDSETYGYITNTPKLKWRNYNFLGYLENHFPNVKTAWTTDVNASAYGEYSVREGINNLVYFTVGTGIGGGGVKNDEFIQGITHPEMGHVSVKKHIDDHFEGICPSHGECLEGLACGPAIEKRLGMSSKDVLATDPYWDIQAYYIAQSAYNATLFLSPEVIVYGGGVMKVEGLLDKVRDQFKKINNDYISLSPLEQYIVEPKLEDTSATIGCFAMAQALMK
ncbi:ROK family protein [Atopobacter phocae]|uniref:ROK family protein n=1 Tax=Atopobacter phocae TaxID=136492 RepID=UPI00047064C0|nr:ROK family protein [Atopobacter phocae]